MKDFVILLILFILIACSRKNSAYLNGDGISDSTKSFQKIVNKTSSGIILLPKGKYRISSTIELPAHITIDGNNSEIVKEGIGFNLFNAVDKSDITIKNLTIRGTMPKPSDYIQSIHDVFLMRLLSCANVTIENVHFTNTAFSALQFENTSNIKVKKCSFSNLGMKIQSDLLPNYSYDAIFIGGDKTSLNIAIDSCVFKDIGNKVHLFSDFASDGDGIHIQSINKDDVRDLSISNNVFESCSRRSIKIQNGKGIKIYNNQFTNTRAGVSFTMVQNTNEVNIEENNFVNVFFPIAFNGDNNESAEKILIENNFADSCYYFIRTSGNSILKNSIVVRNKVNNLSTFFMDGKFENVDVNKNIIKYFNLLKDSDYYMAFLIAQDSKNMNISENEIISKKSEKTILYVQNRTSNINFSDNTIRVKTSPTKDKYLLHYPEVSSVSRGKQINKIILE